MKEMGDGRKMDYEGKMTGGRREERGMKTKKLRSWFHNQCLTRTKYGHTLCM